MVAQFGSWISRWVGEGVVFGFFVLVVMLLGFRHWVTPAIVFLVLAFAVQLVCILVASTWKGRLGLAANALLMLLLMVYAVYNFATFDGQEAQRRRAINALMGFAFLAIMGPMTWSHYRGKQMPAGDEDDATQLG